MVYNVVTEYCKQSWHCVARLKILFLCGMLRHCHCQWSPVISHVKLQYYISRFNLLFPHSSMNSSAKVCCVAGKSLFVLYCSCSIYIRKILGIEIMRINRWYSWQVCIICWCRVRMWRPGACSCTCSASPWSRPGWSPLGWSPRQSPESRCSPADCS